MRLILTEALHARPASLLVRLASQHDAVIEVRRGTCRADARKILDLLSLGAAKGEEIEIFAEGIDAERAVSAIAELVSRSFSGDLVPEHGSGAVEGIAIGRAVVVAARDPASTRAPGGAEEERARLDAAQAAALSQLEALMHALPRAERALFEPEVAIVRDVVARARERVAAGEPAEDAVVALTTGTTTDLIRDARARLLDALAEDDALAEVLRRAAAVGEEVVLVAEALTPSLVASLPGHVRGVVAIDDAGAGGLRTSHAAILARGRELPLAVVESHVGAGIVDGDLLVVDTTGSMARVWVSPSEGFLRDARTRHAERIAARAEVTREASAVATALRVSLLVNLGSFHDVVPDAVAGAGLVRTELFFAGRATPPGEPEQVAVLQAIAGRVGGRPVTVRLFDAGGDKPLAWLPAPPDEPDARGVALLFANRDVLDAQIAAIARAARQAPSLRILIPMAEEEAHLAYVRARLDAAGARDVLVGAMVETRRAVETVDALARCGDFVSIGTNDLTASVLGLSAHARGDVERALEPAVLTAIERVTASAGRHGKRVTVCGEIAAHPLGARVLVGLGVEGLSVAPARVPDVTLALRGATREDCRAAALAALSRP